MNSINGKISYSFVFKQQLQAEKEEAWKAEQLNKSSAIQLAQKELEEVRNHLHHHFSLWAGLEKV